MQDEDESKSSFAHSAKNVRQMVIESGENDASKNQLTVTETYIVKKHSNVYDTLVAAGLEVAIVHEIISSARPFFDLSRMASQTPIILTKSMNDGLIVGLEFIVSKIKSLSLEKQSENNWKASWVEKEVTTKPTVFGGIVSSTFWESAVESGLNPQAISQLADIFAWQLDFEREVQIGDRWQIIINRQLVNDEFIGWGEILAAFYWVRDELYSAIRFEDKNGANYYNLNGASLVGRFLKSPLRYSRISSRFQRERYHPILGVNRPHNGVDYAAPTGTPVRAVADGTITILGRHGGSGKMIKIRHNAVYETAYKHLNGYAKDIHKGSRVVQGQIIGYVGMTGLASGPHLHFEFYENGRFRDPLGVKFPRENILAKEDKLLFDERISQIMSVLEEGGASFASVAKEENKVKEQSDI